MGVSIYWNTNGGILEAPTPQASGSSYGYTGVLDALPRWRLARFAAGWEPAETPDVD